MINSNLRLVMTSLFQIIALGFELTAFMPDP